MGDDTRAQVCIWLLDERGRRGGKEALSFLALLSCCMSTWIGSSMYESGIRRSAIRVGLGGSDEPFGAWLCTVGCVKRLDITSAAVVVGRGRRACSGLLFP